MKRRAMWALVVVYALAAVVSLAQIFLSGDSLASVHTDPLSSILALVLALPWSILLMFFGTVTGLASVIVLGVGMGLNLALLAGIARGVAT